MVKQKPPQKGYVHWDKQHLRAAAAPRTPEPLESRFEVTHGMLLNLLQSAQERAAAAATGGWCELIGRSHAQRLHASAST